MSFCQLPGSPVSHSALLFFSSSLPDRSLSPSLFFLTPPRRPPSPGSIRCPFPGRHSFVAWCQQAPLTSYCLNLSSFSKVTSAPSHKAPGGRSLANPISSLSDARTCVRASHGEHYGVHCCNTQSDASAISACTNALSVFSSTHTQPFCHFTTHLHHIAVTASPVA